jgi:hypothetical protein
MEDDWQWNMDTPGFFASRRNNTHVHDGGHRIVVNKTAEDSSKLLPATAKLFTEGFPNPQTHTCGKVLPFEEVIPLGLVILVCHS